MSVKLAFAAVLRALRHTKGLSQEGLTDATSRTYLGTLEQGKSTPSLDKLHALSTALDVSPLTLLALTLSVHSDKPVSAIVERLTNELTAFEGAGGVEQLKAQMIDGALVRRPAGKLVDSEKLRKVLQCKAEGLSQTETAVRLEMSKSTVHDLWKRELAE